MLPTTNALIDSFQQCLLDTMSSSCAFFRKTMRQPFAAPGQPVITAGHRGRVPEHTHGTLIEPPHARHGQKHRHCEPAESARGVGLDGGHDLPC
uniref:Uncharacterized protein n=1 Tax=Arundo donax TaxID=35708 RepID=A0A0A8XRG7_ARUDO